ncbi:Winged helix DNA-binding domain-containing protein [Microlunatus sagamiharensis]|uniref:Winged helix DNA-binding domain-containing protein n=1 Tax=Microlunatus sagamiharensis TaxID=546874 RepID=A0A1H2MPD3_9ACTN|nr:Winged helix DNA-binding domain-containing protein [Microlunatus sagamiharensis]
MTSSGAVAASARAVVGLHATEPVSVYLSAWARSGATQADVDDALYRERSVVKQLAMRRTLFAFPVDLLPAVRGSAAARVAAQQHGLLARSVVTAGLATDGDAWVERACDLALERLAQEPATTNQLRNQLPMLAVRLPRPENPTSPPAPVAARVLTVLAASGRVVRGNNQGSWTTSKPVWTLVDDWVPGPAGSAEPWGAAEGYAELVRRWLWAYGPGTEADIVWWLGATKSAVRQALADTRAVAVSLEDGAPAWLHPDDVDPVAAPAPWAALLPALDPATMGWRGRTFHIDPRTAKAVYDRAGNGLPTAWWNGRTVGGWTQQADGRVTVVPHVDLPRTAIIALDHQADELTQRLDGQVLRTTFHRPQQEGDRPVTAERVP